MANKNDNKRMQARQMRWVAAGFSLVEIMVGMVVGLITIIVIMQSFAAFEGQKRTTSSGSDTQENGLIALQAIEGDARTAGYGLITPKGLACTSMNYYEAGASGVASLAPVAVVDGGAAGGSDTLLFTAATSPLAGTPFILDDNILIPDQIAWLPPAMQADQDLFLVAAPIDSPGVGVQPIPCSRLAFASAVPSPVRMYNTPNTMNFFPLGGYAKSSGYYIDIGSGPGFVRKLYRVGNNDLVVQDVSRVVAQSGVALASNIVNMQVQYGVAPINTQPGAASPAVNCWTDAAGNGCNSLSGDWANPNAADIMRIKAIRIAVVARSSLQEKPSTPGGACDATPAAITAWAGGPTVDLTANANWNCHRYRVYQTIIPLRNVIWANI